MVQHNRVLLQGSIGTEEVWSVGINFMPAASTPASYVTTQADLNGWAGVISAVLDNPAFASLALAMSTVTSIDTIVTQKIAADNTVERQSIPVDSDYVGNGAAYKPYPTCVVLSLRTGLPGASFRGRTYWPATGIGVNEYGRNASTLDMAQDYAAMLYEIATAAVGFGTAEELRPCVFSRTKDLVTPVTQIRVGDVPDVQRRRRDALAEDYSSVTYPDL